MWFGGWLRTPPSFISLSLSHSLSLPQNTWTCEWNHLKVTKYCVRSDITSISISWKIEKLVNSEVGIQSQERVCELVIIKHVIEMGYVTCTTNFCTNQDNRHCMGWIHLWCTPGIIPMTHLSIMNEEFGHLRPLNETKSIQNFIKFTTQRK